MDHPTFSGVEISNVNDTISPNSQNSAAGGRRSISQPANPAGSHRAGVGSSGSASLISPPSTASRRRSSVAGGPAAAGATTGAGLGTYQPHQPMGFAGIGFTGTQSGITANRSYRSFYGRDANNNNAAAASTSGNSASAGSPSAAAATAGTLTMAQSMAMAQSSIQAGVHAAMERQRMPLLQVIGDALRTEEFGNMELQAKLLRRKVHKGSYAQQHLQQQSGSSVDNSPVGSARSSPKNSPNRIRPQQDDQLGGSGPIGRNKPGTAGSITVVDQPNFGDDGQNDDWHQVHKPTSAGYGGYDSSGDEQQQQHPEWSPVRMEFSGDGLYRRRLTVEEQRELEEAHHRTTADVRERAKQATVALKQEHEDQLENSRRKAAFAHRWRSFEQKKRRTQVQLLWSTILLAVIMMRKWDRERRVRVASAMMARSVVPMLRWRHRRKERRRVKDEILDHFDAPPLTADLLMTDPLLKFFGRAHLAEIIPFARLEAFLRDYNLVYFREPGRDCFILVHGEVDVWIESPTGRVGRGEAKYSLEKVAVLRAPYVVGSVGMVTKEKRNARLTCRTDVIAYVIDHKDFITKKPDKELMVSAMAEARRQHLLNMTALYRTYLNGDSLARYYTMEHLPDHLLNELAKKLTPTMRKPGEYIIRAGERSSSMYLLFEGKVDICPPEDDWDTPHQTHIERAFAMIDIMGPANLKQARADGLRYQSRKQRLEHESPIRPYGYMPTADTPETQREKEEQQFSARNPHMMGQLNANELLPRTHNNMVSVTIKAKSLLKYMIGGPRFFLLDTYDMNVVVRNAVDLFEIKRDDFMRIMMQSPAAIVDTRALCMRYMAEYLEPPRDQEIAATVFGEYPTVKYSRRMLQSGDFGKLLAERPVVIPAGTPLAFDNTCKQHHDIFFVLRGEISRVQRRKLDVVGGASGEDDDGSPTAGGVGSSPSPPASGRRAFNQQQQSKLHSAASFSFGGSGARGRRPNTGQSKDGTFSFNAATNATEQQYLMWPSLSQIFYSNQSYSQTVTKRIEGFRVTRGALLKWICSVLGGDDERWALFRAAIVKPYGHEDRAPLFHALTTDEHTREVFVRRHLVKELKIKFKTDDPDMAPGASAGDAGAAGGSNVVSLGAGFSPPGIRNPHRPSSSSQRNSSLSQSNSQSFADGVSDSGGSMVMARGVSGLSQMSKVSLGSLGSRISRGRGGGGEGGGGGGGGAAGVALGRTGSMSRSPHSSPSSGPLRRESSMQQRQQQQQQQQHDKRSATGGGASSSASGGSGGGAAAAAAAEHHQTSPVQDVAAAMAAQIKEPQPKQQQQQKPVAEEEGRSLRETGRKVSIRMENGDFVQPGQRREASLEQEQHQQQAPRRTVGEVGRRSSIRIVEEEEIEPGTDTSRIPSVAGSIPGLAAGSPKPPAMGDDSPGFGSLTSTYGSGQFLPPLPGTAAAGGGGADSTSASLPSGGSTGHKFQSPEYGRRAKAAFASSSRGNKRAQQQRIEGELFTAEQERVVLARFRRPMDEAIAEAAVRHERFKKSSQRSRSPRRGTGNAVTSDADSKDGASAGEEEEEVLLDPVAIEARRLDHGGVAHVPLSTLTAARQRAAASSSRAKRRSGSLPVSSSAAATTTNGATSIFSTSHDATAGDLPASAPSSARLNVGGGGLVTSAASPAFASSVSAPPLAALWGSSTEPQPMPSSHSARSSAAEAPRRQALAGSVGSYKKSQHHGTNSSFEKARQPVLDRLKKKRLQQE